MECTSTRLPYRQTGAFSKIALDYIDQAEQLRPFFTHPPSLQGLKKAIEQRKQFNTDRGLLVSVLKKQYELVPASGAVQKHIELLASPDTFTITTAHQNNIFSGPLYFIYKILHAIKLAEQLQTSLPEFRFVPVFYMGTEDADLEELNHIYLGEEKLVWNTRQTGAVGRMKIDAELLKLVEKMEGQLLVQPFGKEIIALLRECYKRGEDIQTATFRFVNSLFGQRGLVVLLPDNAVLKRSMIPVFEDDLLNQAASGIVEKTAGRLESAGYKAQAHPREINVFYLYEDLRERIEKVQDAWRVVKSGKTFSREQLLGELREQPERFSPNVILRGLYQETILPNIAFIGGGGETAYWLQYKDLFAHYQVPFPVLILRNSFLLLEKKWQEKISRMGFTAADFFLPVQELLNRLVRKESKNEIRLNGSLTELEQLYESFKKQAAAVDSTLLKHVDALKSRSVQRLQELEKKMLRAEKRKYSDQQRQIRLIRDHLFPGDGLQERRENLAYYYAKWGSDLLDRLYEHSLALEQEFVVITEK